MHDLNGHIYYEMNIQNLNKISGGYFYDFPVQSYADEC